MIARRWYDRRIKTPLLLVAVALLVTGCSDSPGAPSRPPAVTSPDPFGAAAPAAPASVVAWRCLAASASGSRSADCPTMRRLQTRQYAAGAVSAPGVPSGLVHSVTLLTVTLSWTAPAGGDAPTSYLVEAGSTSGAADLASFDTGSDAVTLTVTDVPPDVYFVRVRARNSSGTSGASNEVVVEVSGGGPCAGPPGPPTELTSTSAGSTVSLAWKASATGCTPTGYTLEAGSVSGAKDLKDLTLFSPAPSYVAGGVADGTYYVRVRATTVGFVSPPSNEVVVTVSANGTVPTPPNAPTLSRISPASGTAGTRVLVTLTGTNFIVNGTEVKVDWSNAAGFAGAAGVSVTDGTTMTATLLTDGAAPGAHSVNVTTLNGASAPVIFTVLPPAAVIGAFAASPSSISAGGTATLSWSGIANATSCAIDNGVGAVSCAAGSHTVTPAATTTYTLTATGPAGNATAATTVTINAAANPPTIGSFAASPSSIQAGGTSTLSWSGIANATSCAIDAGIGAVSCAAGSHTVTPAATTTYTLTATGPAGSATAPTTVTITAAGTPPPVTIASFAASPLSIQAGGTSTLTWSGIANATTCAIDNGIGTVSCANGTRTVTPSATTTYTLTATGSAGSATAATTVTITAAGTPPVTPPVTPPATPPVTIASFAASPASIPAGGSSTLSWSGIADATACSIDNGIGTVSCANGTRTVTPSATTTYTLTATGAAGQATTATTVTITAAGPQPLTIGSFAASPSSVQPGGTATLSWSGLANAIVCSISVIGVGTSPGPVPCADGTRTVTPAVTTVYNLRANGVAGIVEAQTVVAVAAAGAPPLTIGSFTASPASTPAGGSTTLAWSRIENASSCYIDNGLGEIENNGLIPGSVTCGGGTRLATPRTTTTYTLTAWNPSGSVTAATATVTVTAGAPPATPSVTIDSFAASPSSAAAGGTSTLSWSGITNATACAINNGVGTVSCTAGRRTVTPSVTTTYILTATGTGGSATAATTVTITPPANSPTIASFAASPSAVQAGNPSTLAWSGIANATNCTIDNGVGAVSCAGGSTAVTPQSPSTSIGVVTSRTYTFTATGAAGTATASATVTVASGSQVFPDEGREQFFSVPAGVTRLTITASGGAGGPKYPTPSAKGGTVTATIAVTPGETLGIFVGNLGSTNGGCCWPIGGGGQPSGTAHGSNGGGASDVRQGGLGLANRVVVAGGGGGAVIGGAGGDGGGLIAGGGSASGSAHAAVGGGGSQGAGGAGGVGTTGVGTGQNGEAGSSGSGGGGNGGGGGGGYFGGGGGASSGGGGGGSSYTSPSATNVSHIQGNNAGDGRIVLTW